MDPTLRALNRFGLGARIGERDTVRDPRAWLLDQLDPAADPPTSPGLPTVAEAGRALRALRMTQGRDAEAAREARSAFQGIRQAEARFTLEIRVETNRPFVERLVAFWSNHLCVSLAGRQPVVVLAGLYEREVVRPHVLGRFGDMLLASARHPAMLFYLDNFQSVGPNSNRASRVALRQGRERGVNENYARELMELHSLGVNGGYGQSDVESLARMLTGWTLKGAGTAGLEDLGFRFDSAMHEPGGKTLLGVRYRGDGVNEGESAIRALAAHPSTARFLATKLVKHFVSDDPPARAVDHVAATFTESEGNLRDVSAALVEIDEAWQADTRKIRSPQDWLVAVFRATGGARGGRAVPPQMPQWLGPLRQPLWAPPSPKGYGDQVGDWTDPDGLMNRAELARTLVQRMPPRQLDPAGFLDLVEVPSDDPIRELASTSSIPVEERVALSIAGPAFQWR